MQPSHHDLAVSNFSQSGVSRHFHPLRRSPSLALRAGKDLHLGFGRLLLVACLAIASTIIPAQAERRKIDKSPVTLPPPTPRAAPAAPAETKIYDPQLMRLAEILGALTYLRGLCGEKDGAMWRSRMQALLDAEGSPPIRKDRLAGSYNRGLEGYSLTYRTCTPNAHIVIDRFLEEGGRIAKDVENRYHAS